MERNIFETASKKKLRFHTEKGMISTEDLWDLPLKTKNGTCLNSLAMKFYKLHNQSEINFVERKVSNSASSDDKLRFDIIMHIIEARQEEAENKEKALVKKQKKDKIKQLIANKKDEAMSNLSVEDLEKMLDEL